MGSREKEGETKGKGKGRKEQGKRKNLEDEVCWIAFPPNICLVPGSGIDLLRNVSCVIACSFKALLILLCSQRQIYRKVVPMTPASPSLSLPLTLLGIESRAFALSYTHSPQSFFILRQDFTKSRGCPGLSSNLPSSCFTLFPDYWVYRYKALCPVPTSLKRRSPRQF